MPSTGWEYGLTLPHTPPHTHTLCVQHFSIMSQFCAKHRLGARPAAADTHSFSSSGIHEKLVVEADGPPPLDDADKILSLQVCGGAAGCLAAWSALLVGWLPGCLAAGWSAG